jgi:FdhD protein
MAPVRPGPTTRAGAWEVAGGRARPVADELATEEPLEIRLVSDGRLLPLAVTMRTPGADFELAAGFLYSEGLVDWREQVGAISYCTDRSVGEPQRYNIVNVVLAAPVEPAALRRLERHFTVSSACGVCGKATLESLRSRGYRRLSGGPVLAPEVVSSLPAKLRAAQRVFEATGGLHAAAAFDEAGGLVALREDVGRHNAMDKLAGWALLEGRLPLARHALLVSGRSSFELVQKALRLGAGVLCSVSAPSSLAVDLAREFGLTLVGFLRDGRFKVYSCPERLLLSPAPESPGVESPAAAGAAPESPAVESPAAAGPAVESTIFG